MQVEFAMDSTRGPAPAYAADMRSSTILIPLLFILADGVRCKDDAPAGGEFGEPCGGDITTPCAEGLMCNIGYCEEKCSDDSDCQPIEGYLRECDFGMCHILCDEATKACPQNFEVPLKCEFLWCASEL